MTQRVQGLLVILAEDLRLDDAQSIVTALKMVRGVRDVQPVEADADAQIARVRERTKVMYELHGLADRWAQSSRDGKVKP